MNISNSFLIKITYVRRRTNMNFYHLTSQYPIPYVAYADLPMHTMHGDKFCTKERWIGFGSHRCYYSFSIALSKIGKEIEK